MTAATEALIYKLGRALDSKSFVYTHENGRITLDGIFTAHQLRMVIQIAESRGPYGADVTTKFDAFKADLVALCARHRVMLGSSLYDAPAVYDMKDSGEAIYADQLEDRTEPQPRQEGARKET